jgi:hypothetical protein
MEAHWRGRTKCDVRLDRFSLSSPGDTCVIVMPDLPPHSSRKLPFYERLARWHAALTLQYGMDITEKHP